MLKLKIKNSSNKSTFVKIEKFKFDFRLTFSKSNQFEFEWARQSIISMQLAANYYENILDIQASKNPKFSGLNGREIAMHQNMMWIVQVMAKVIY